MWANLVIADRLAPPFRPTGPEEELIERYHEVIGWRTGGVRAGVSALLALIAGPVVAGVWNSWLLVTNGGCFGVADPQFGPSSVYYVVKLQFFTFLTT